MKNAIGVRPPFVFFLTPAVGGLAEGWMSGQVGGWASKGTKKGSQTETTTKIEFTNEVNKKTKPNQDDYMERNQA